MAARKSSKSRKRRSRARTSCAKLTRRGCSWKIGTRKASASQVRKRIGSKRMSSIRASARRRSLSRGVKQGRKQAVRKTKTPQCIISARGRCEWYINGRKTTLASLQKRFSATQLAAAKKRARMNAIQKGIAVGSGRRRTRSTSRKPRKAKSATRKTKRSRSASRTGRKKRKLPKALQLWGQAARESGFMKKNQGVFRPLPPCGSTDYDIIKARYEELKVKHKINKPTRPCKPRK